MTRTARTRLLCVGLSAALTVWAAPGQAQDLSIDEREAAIFGEPHDDFNAPDADSASVEDREAALFGSADPDPPSATSALGDSIAARLAARDAHSLDIGGSLFSQLNYAILERGDLAEFPLTQPNLLDVYLDARPNNRLRVYADARLRYTPTTSADSGLGATSATPTDASLWGAPDDPLRAQLDELWLKFDIYNTVFVTAGRQHLRWGVGRFWYPNDFLFEQRRDPLALVDVRTGVDLLKFHLPLESMGWNFYAVANLDGAHSPETLGGAGRAEFLVATAEIGLSAAAQKDKPVQLGADISAGVGPFDLRAAATLIHNLETPFFRGTSNLADFDTIDIDNLGDLQLPERYSRQDEWIPRALIGAEVGIPFLDDDTIYLGGEYFFNAAGYDDADIYPWLILNGAFRPLYSGRHYAALYALMPSPGDWNDTSFTLSTLGNLSDLSFLSRLDYSVRVLTHMRVFAFSSITYGRSGEFTLGLRVPAISGDILAAAAASGQFSPPAGLALEDGFPGLSLAATRATIGAGLSLNF